MIDDLADILNRLVNQKDNLHVRFPDPDISEPELAFKVPFPRLEIVLEGELKESGLPLSETMLSASQVLYVQAGKWTLPEWTAPASTLSILFGRQKLGFCVQHWDGKQLRTEKQTYFPLGFRPQSLNAADTLSSDAASSESAGSELTMSSGPVTPRRLSSDRL